MTDNMKFLNPKISYTFEKRQVASEWDGCWFCTECNSMHHWTEEAYVSISGDGHYCEDCIKQLPKYNVI